MRIDLVPLGYSVMTELLHIISLVIWLVLCINVIVGIIVGMLARRIAVMVVTLWEAVQRKPDGSSVESLRKHKRVLQPALLLRDDWRINSYLPIVTKAMSLLLGAPNGLLDVYLESVPGALSSLVIPDKALGGEMTH
jgi:hypothetical protein